MKSVIFNTQEVISTLEGRKSQFRKVIKSDFLCAIAISERTLTDEQKSYIDSFAKFCPFQVGDKIFVKEEFFEDLIYRKFAGFDEKENLIKISPRYMKQHQSRLTLRITNISVERLAEISEEDCWAEGGEDIFNPLDDIKVCDTASKLGMCIDDTKPFFATYWNSTHKKPSEKFESNCWVWKVCFEVVR